MWDRLMAWLLSYFTNQLNRMEDQLMALQDDVNTRADQLTAAIQSERDQVSAAVNALAAEVQSLKDQIAAGQTADFTRLDAAIADVQNIFTPSA